MKYIVADNTSRLAKELGLNQMTLGKKSGTSQTTVGRMMKASEDSQDPKLSTIDGAAKGMSISTWKLFFEDMPIELFKDSGLDQMIRLYAQCSEGNRAEIFDQIKKVSETEYF